LLVDLECHFLFVGLLNLNFFACVNSIEMFLP
jgi:hypothetical protein